MEYSKNIFKASNCLKDLSWSIGIAGLHIELVTYDSKFIDFSLFQSLGCQFVFLSREIACLSSSVKPWHTTRKNHFTMYWCTLKYHL